MRVDYRNGDRQRNRQLARRGTNLERYVRFRSQADGTARRDKAARAYGDAGAGNHHADRERNKELCQRRIGSFRNDLGLGACIHIAARFDCAENLHRRRTDLDVDKVEPGADDRNQRLRLGAGSGNGNGAARVDMRGGGNRNLRRRNDVHNAEVNARVANGNTVGNHAVRQVVRRKAELYVRVFGVDQQVRRAEHAVHRNLLAVQGDVQTGSVEVVNRVLVAVDDEAGEEAVTLNGNAGRAGGQIGRRKRIVHKRLARGVSAARDFRFCNFHAALVLQRVGIELGRVEEERNRLFGNVLQRDAGYAADHDRLARAILLEHAGQVNAVDTRSAGNVCQRCVLCQRGVNVDQVVAFPAVQGYGSAAGVAACSAAAGNGDRVVALAAIHRSRRVAFQLECDRVVFLGSVNGHFRVLCGNDFFERQIQTRQHNVYSVNADVSVDVNRAGGLGADGVLVDERAFGGRFV